MRAIGSDGMRGLAMGYVERLRRAPVLARRHSWVRHSTPGNERRGRLGTV